MLINKQKIQELNEIFSIAPDNKAVHFLYWRLLQDGYRGMHLTQHNRWTIEKFKAIIFAIYNIKNDKGYIKIPRGDEGKDFYIGEYPEYKKLVNSFLEEYKKLTGKNEGTPNSIKKNLLVDLSRMGIISRYHITNKEKHPIRLEPWTRKSVDLIKVNDSINLTKSKLSDDIFLDTLFKEKSKYLYNINNLPFLLFEILCEEKLKGFITEYEFLFFITWNNYQYLDKIFDHNLVVEMILNWRKLNFSAKKSIINLIKKWANRKNYLNFPKNQKRDFENWKNETKQIMQHIKESELFATNEKGTELLISFKKTSNNIKRYRSEEPKKEYLKYHKINKEKGFEFDHIVPFSWSMTHEDAVRISSWKNLIYIDARSHAIKSQTNNKYVYLDKRDEISCIYLVADDKDFLYLKLKENVLLDMNLFDELKKYNINLNNFISQK